MADTAIQIKTREGRSESGQTFRLLATTPSRRIVGTVDVLVPLDKGYTLELQVGKDRQREILELAEKLARMVADAVENTQPIEH